MVNRREFLWGCSALLATDSHAEEVPITALTEYERGSGGHVGVYAENINTGAKIAWRAQQRFVMCSTFKASLAACVLLRVDHGQDDLDAQIPYGANDIEDWHAPVAKANVSKGRLSLRQMCQAAVEQSDNTCANLLLARIGGPSSLTKFWRQSGDRISRLDATEPLLNRTPLGGLENTTTPAAMARTLHRLVLGSVLSKPSRDALTGWLVGCQTGANRLRAGLPARWTIGDKTGNNGSDAAGDIAIVWPQADQPIVICVYTRGGQPSDQQIEAVFAGIGNAIGERLK